MNTIRPAALALVCAAIVVWPASRQPKSAGLHDAAGPARPRAADLWLAPSAQDVAARAALTRAVVDLTEGRPADAVGPFERATADPVLGGYALLYLGRAQLAAGDANAALASVRRLRASSPSGFLEEASLWLAADVAVAVADSASALSAAQQLANVPTVASPTIVQLRLGRAAKDAGDRDAAIRAFASIYFGSPLAPEASDAADELADLKATPAKASPESLALFLDRAERLFGGKQYADARAAYDIAQPLATDSDRDLIELRLAECDFYQKRYQAALAALTKYRSRSKTRAAEVEYFYLSAVRELGRTNEYLARLREFVDAGADPTFAERALNDLAAFHTLANDDEQAAAAFAELYRRFPSGAFAERAAWKSGWWAYKAGEFAEAARVFESASIVMRHADLRPAWLYWAARAHLQARETDAAMAGLDHTIGDYRNTYYGRLATRDRERVLAARRPAGAGAVLPASREPSAATTPLTIEPGARPDNATLIQGLLAAGMYDEAIGELRRVQATSGTSPMVEATIAFALNRQGRLRPGIQAMRRAYPQFLAAGGEALPEEILTVIFPVDHWDVIQQHALGKQLDRFLVAALIAQESTFQADIKSAANAWGLMQIVPATGREYATRLGIRPFSTNRLTDPEVNVQIGTTYFSDLVKRFGGVVPALAAYNAGPSRVVKWTAERPGMEQEEFIDDIPFAETQNYVKRILGTAEDYRRLYR